MKIALSGTPGVGKSNVADVLERIGYKVVRVEELAHEFIVGYDAERQSSIIDEEALDKYVKKLRGQDILIIEGHVSHLLSVNYVILLRCHPEELRVRLMNKGWHEKKIMENLMAEALDIILQRALETHKSIWEIDTTNKDAQKVAKEIDIIVKTMPPPCYGQLDWSKWIEDYVG